MHHHRPAPNSKVVITAAILSLAAVGASEPACAQNARDNTGNAGEQIYMEARCFACHGQYGFGGAGPRFRENRFLGLKDYVVGQILVGRGIMPSFADTLNDQQIAAVATYIRTSWGNNFGEVKPSDVAEARKEVQLHPPQGQPHLPPAEQQPPPVPPRSSLPPGQTLPPDQTK